MIKFLKILMVAIALFIGYQVIATSLQSNLFKEWDALAAIPWMRATLWDFYANVLVISLWVCYKEKYWYGKLGWITALCLLGSIATCTYVLVQLFRLKKGEAISAIFQKN